MFTHSIPKAKYRKTWHRHRNALTCNGIAKRNFKLLWQSNAEN
nr:MAG TPA: hypothetical protein [Caudoviricetes sp.]